MSDYTVETNFCDECQQHYVRVTGYVSRGETALAAYYAVCHGHPDHEVALDVILGTWGVEEEQTTRPFRAPSGLRERWPLIPSSPSRLTQRVTFPGCSGGLSDVPMHSSIHG